MAVLSFLFEPSILLSPTALVGLILGARAAEAGGFTLLRRTVCAIRGHDTIDAWCCRCGARVRRGRHR